MGGLFLFDLGGVEGKEKRNKHMFGHVHNQIARIKVSFSVCLEKRRRFLVYLMVQPSTRAICLSKRTPMVARFRSSFLGRHGICLAVLRREAKGEQRQVWGVNAFAHSILGLLQNGPFDPQNRKGTLNDAPKWVCAFLSIPFLGLA